MEAMISVRDLWKVYGPRAERLVGSADADLPRAELEARLGNVVAMREVNLDVAPGETFSVRIENHLVRPLTAGAGGPSVEVKLDGVLFWSSMWFMPTRMKDL